MTDLTPADSPAPPAVPAADPSASAVAVPTNPPKGKGLGVFALVLGLLAFLGDIVLIIIAIVGAVGLAQSVSGGTFDISTLLLGLGGFIFIAFIALIVGLIVAALAILLGIIAAVKNRGRAAGITGAVFGLLVLFTHGSVLATFLGSGDLLSQLNGLGT
jgi:hypothetical protein